MSRWETTSRLEAGLDPALVEHEDGRLFTDEARLPGVIRGHRHLVEASGGTAGPPGD